MSNPSHVSYQTLHPMWYITYYWRRVDSQGQLRRFTQEFNAPLGAAIPQVLDFIESTYLAQRQGDLIGWELEQLITRQP